MERKRQFMESPDEEKKIFQRQNKQRVNFVKQLTVPTLYNNRQRRSEQIERKNYLWIYTSIT